MVPKVQSAGGVVYYIDSQTQEYRFLLVKRFALSKKVERIAPKGKIHPAETPEQAALREIQEETWLKREFLQVKQLIDTISLQLYNEGWMLGVDKDITYYLVKYTGDLDQVKIADAEGFLGMYKWATIQDVLGLVIYKDLREVFRKAYMLIGTVNKRDSFIQLF